MTMDVGQFVVVEPGPGQVGLIHPEAERLDEVQRRPGVGAQPDDVAGVRGDLGLNQDDVQATSVAERPIGVTREAGQRWPRQH